MTLPQLRFRLRTRIFLGFGVLITLLLGIAGYGSYGLSLVQRAGPTPLTAWGSTSHPKPGSPTP
jgi:hypothetical protein